MTALKGAQVDAFLARPDPARPIVLLFGPDAGLVRERAEALIQGAVDDPRDPFALARLAGDRLAAGRVRGRAKALIKGAIDDPRDPLARARRAADELAAEPMRLVEEANTIPLFG